MSRLTILICTHNRAALLEKTLASLNAAQPPNHWEVNILVAANACSDGTPAFLDRYRRQAEKRGWLPLSWFAEPTPGKSFAINAAISRLKSSDIVTFVDDDHRVDNQYLVAVCNAADTYPDISMFCGRILPDWDGTEPHWVHDTGPYRIYPLPIPRQDLGPSPRHVTADRGPLPGGGNLFLRAGIFARVGGFSTDLGPKGHDLGGGEDSAFILNALNKGETLQYVPQVLQHHYVDHERLRIFYLARKAYQRSRSISIVHQERHRVPLYMWRKLAEYGLRAIFPLSWPHMRFYLMRVASTLGEIRGLSAAARRAAREQPKRPKRSLAYPMAFVAFTAAGLFGLIIATSREAFNSGFIGTLAVAGTLTLGLLAKSIVDFSLTGPQIRGEILANFGRYSLMAFCRLSSFAFLILYVQAATGALVYGMLSYIFHFPFTGLGAALAALGAIIFISGLQFLRHLLYLPASLAASSHYRLSRLYPLWGLLSPQRLQLAGWLPALVIAGLALWTLISLIKGGEYSGAASTSAFMAAAATLYVWLQLRVNPLPRRAIHTNSRPNVLMIGSDTLRADRIDQSHTPFLYELAKRGTRFTHCYVPCARTAPSLISLLTGTWPTTHGVRDNFVASAKTRLPVPSLPKVLRDHGYVTSALSDWCGADMGKFSFGFDFVDLPEDQWNLRFLIRQGPKDLRLFLSLFTHNAFGKHFLPEIHYLGGIPLTDELGSEACGQINYFANQDNPFLLNLFFSTTHPPFGSEYPYYTMYSSPDYAGESKFAMARLTDPWEIIRRQAEPREAFDLDQIIHLYDGCVRRFDDEVRRIVTHLEECGIGDNTLLVIYADHGTEFFEHDTWGQGNSAFSDHSARIPLIIVDPRLQGGQEVDDIVRSIDVMPTLLELLGIQPAPQEDGVSLASYLRERNAALDLAAYNETGIWLTAPPNMPVDHLHYPDLLELLEVPDKVTGTLAIKPEYRDIVVAAKDRMLRKGRWKLVYQPLTSGFRLLLFDTVSDPLCGTDLANEQPDVVQELWRVMHCWIDADRLETATATPSTDE
jgi:arylsulfatase A-like enzyme/glycosyltransferase involved in cell wall biosynthesis